MGKSTLICFQQLHKMNPKRLTRCTDGKEVGRIVISSISFPTFFLPLQVSPANISPTVRVTNIYYQMHSYSHRRLYRMPRRQLLI